MRKSFLFISCAALLAQDLQASFRSQEPKEEFLAAYRRGVVPLVHFYENVRIRYREVNKEPSQETRTYEKVYLANAPRFRLDTKGPEERNKGLRIQVVNPLRTSFSIFKGRERQSFELYHVTTDHDDKLEALRQFSPIPSYLYCMYYVPIVELCDHPSFRIVNVESVKQDDETLVKMYYVRTYEQAPALHGWVIFAPNDCWAVRERKGGTGSSLRYRISYQGREGAIPLVKGLVLWSEDEMGNKIGTETDVEVLELTPGPVPEEEFTLAAFGLSDAGLQATVPPWFYYQLIALLAAATAFVFWRLARRRRSPSGRV